MALPDAMKDVNIHLHLDLGWRLQYSMDGMDRSSKNVVRSIRDMAKVKIGYTKGKYNKKERQPDGCLNNRCH